MINFVKTEGVFLAIIFFAIFGLAQTSDAAKVINVVNTSGQPSCEAVDVQSAINSASDGDMVFVPTGSCTWTNVLSINKSLTLLGAGSSNTLITDRTSNTTPLINVDMDLNESVRISGFSFTGTGTVDSFGCIEIEGTSQTFRIDHNNFANYATRALYIHGYTYGLVDHNAFTNCKEIGAVYGEANADIAWLRPYTPGTANAVYFEDNTSFVDLEVATTWFGIDAQKGGRYVARKNIFTNISTGSHGYDSPTRSQHTIELYNNTYIYNGSNRARAIHMRGGTGFIFNETVVKGYNSFAQLDNYRSCLAFDCCTNDSTKCSGGCWLGSCWESTSGLCTKERCDGNSANDGNTPGMMGYPCKDQIGRTTGQVLYPFYEWNNSFNGASAHFTVTTHTGCANPSTIDHIAENRDYYNHNTSFDGTIGVGSGAGASKPSTCTTGVGYWATDEGEWDSTHAGNDGRLYRCVNSAWELAYTPYAYPHPLTLSDDITPPVPPTGIVVE